MKVVPIQAQDIDDVGAFLHQHLNRRIAAPAWAASLRHRWAPDAPNHGMQLLTDHGHRVGVLCALYSEQTIGGRTVRLCNPHSWCVLDEFRHASIGLVLAVIRQRGYHFTMFTPNPKVTQVFLGLRFKPLDDGLLHFPNLAWPWPASGVATADPQRVEALLEGSARAEYLAHRDIPWLCFVAFGRPGDMVLAIYKRGRWKKLPCALLCHLSDREAAVRHGALLRGHLLRRGMPVSRLEVRFVATAPPLARQTRRTQPKLVLSDGLADHQVRDVYSELMALDI